MIFSEWADLVVPLQDSLARLLVDSTLPSVSEPISRDISDSGQNIPRFQASDWISVVNAVMAAVSAAAAVVAVRIAVGGALEQRSERQGDRSRFLYRRLVLDVSLETIPRFISEAAEALDSAQDKVATLDFDLMSHAAVLGEAKVTSDDFNRRFFKFRNALRGALISWNDEPLSEAVTKEMEALQDAVVSAIAKLPTPEALTEPLSATLIDHGARLQRLIAGYDATRRQPPPKPEAVRSH